MNTPKITALLSIAQLAIELHNAKNTAKSAQHDYHEKLDAFERDVRTLPHERVDKLDPNNADFIDFTMMEYHARRKARCVAYNIKRWLDTACRKSHSL